MSDSRTDPQPHGREAEPFWSGLADGRLMLQHCPNCDELVFYPRVACPRCHATELSWVEHAGSGIVYSYTVVHKRDSDPYTVLLVELGQHARILVRLDSADEERVGIGESVELRIDDVDGTRWFLGRPSRLTR